MLKIAITLAAALALGACAPFQPYSEQTSEQYYIVQPGDNIDSIAFMLETTPQQLQSANRWVDTRKLQTGMRLSIPGVRAAETYAPDELEPGSGEFFWPLKRFEVSSNFGSRYGRPHRGIDLRAPRGTPIHAAATGRVKFAGRKRGYGTMIVIDHGGGIETVYAHNSRNLVAVGQRIAQGEIIGRVGQSGNATGSHLHFEYRRHGQALDPTYRMQAGL